MLASIPASTLNQNTVDLGIPHRFNPKKSDSKYLIRDNDRAFGAVFKARVQAVGIRDRPTSFRSPWQNGHIERLIGPTRHECTDHVIVFNEAHLRRILSKYAGPQNGSSHAARRRGRSRLD